jgi:hypothetical protein
MVRARLATLTVAGGLLLGNSGCTNMWERFQCWRANGGFHQSAANCPCQEYGDPGAVGTSMQTAGPVLVSPDAGMPAPAAPAFPPQQPQVGPPPRIHPIPANPAVTTPWSGTSLKRR